MGYLLFEVFGAGCECECCEHFCATAAAAASTAATTTTAHDATSATSSTAMIAGRNFENAYWTLTTIDRSITYLTTFLEIARYTIVFQTLFSTYLNTCIMVVPSHKCPNHLCRIPFLRSGGGPVSILYQGSRRLCQLGKGRTGLGASGGCQSMGPCLHAKGLSITVSCENQSCRVTGPANWSSCLDFALFASSHCPVYERFARSYINDCHERKASARVLQCGLDR